MEKIKVVVHDGHFHGDDVFSVATLSLALGVEISGLEIKRSRDAEIINNAEYVLDVGNVLDVDKNKFDHHLPISLMKKRADGIPYSTVGLLWKKYGEKICDSKEVAERIDKRIIKSIDATDNGIELSKSISDIKEIYLYDLVDSYSPICGEESTSENGFIQAVEFIRGYLLRIIKREKSTLKARKYFSSIYNSTDDKKIIVLDKNCPWEEFSDDYQDVYFVVSPASNCWKAKGVKVSNTAFDIKKSYPKEWAGKTNEELQQISGISDAVFCHPSLFTAGAKSKDGAIAMAKKALEN